jgi:phosphotransferase system enzyme I (PtsP)
MAADRGNSRVADRFDPLGRPFLRVLRQIVEAANRTDTTLTLCGEIAGKSLSAMALLGIGFRHISMSPAAIGPVKSMLLSLDLGKLEEAVLPPPGPTGARSRSPGFPTPGQVRVCPKRGLLRSQ